MHISGMGNYHIPGDNWLRSTCLVQIVFPSPSQNGPGILAARMVVRENLLTWLDVSGYNDSIFRFCNNRTNRIAVCWLKKFRTVEYPGRTHLCSLSRLRIDYTSKNSATLEVFSMRNHLTDRLRELSC